jgi:uncharacterized protein (TIGR02145 family)
MAWPIPEDAKNWLEAVVKPYRVKRQNEELQAQLEAAKQREAELRAQIEASKIPAPPPISASYAQYRQQPPKIHSALSTPHEKEDMPGKGYLISFAVVVVIIIAYIIIKKEPNDKTYFDSGNAHYRNKDYDKAIEDYTAAIKIKSGDPVYFNRRGNAYYGKKDYDKAIEDYTAAIKIKSNNPVYFCNRGDALFNKKDYRNAIVDYTAAINLKPDEPDYLNNRGNAYYNKEDYALAVADWEAVLRINPEHTNVRQNLEKVRQAQDKKNNLGESSSIVSNQKTITDSRDGKKYKIVEIDAQTWMAENLNYNMSGSICYDNEEDNCIKYGRLYNWQTAKKSCPQGWHLPTKKEWDVLSNYVGGSSVAGKYLKAKSGWDEYKGQNGNGTDGFGFSALPGGDANTISSFFVGKGGLWWSSSEYSGSRAYRRGVYWNRDGADWDNADKKSVLFSVRCVQDNSNSVTKVKPPITIINSSSSHFQNSQIKPNSDTIHRISMKKVTDSDEKEKFEIVRDGKKAIHLDILIEKPLASISSNEKFIDSRNNNSYKIVKIGSQVWMAENLNYNVSDSKCFNNSESNCKRYGRLYNWKTARIVCPSGWHLPTKNEWDVLSNFVGGSSVEGKHLKAKFGWNSSGNGQNTYGFAAIPGGFGNSRGSFSSAGDYGYWWSASEYDGGTAYSRRIYYNYDGADWVNYVKDDLRNVRCVQN